MVGKGVAKSYHFDYVYYPKPIGFNGTGDFGKAADTCLQSIKSKMEVYSSGKPIFHINPLMFYCKEIAEAFGLKPKPADKQKMAEAEYPPIPKEEQYSRDPVQFKHTDTTHYPIAKPRVLKSGKVDLANYYEENPSVVTKLLDLVCEEYTLLTWSQMNDFQIPAKISNLSYEGTVMYGGNIPDRKLANLIGESICYMRETFKAIWYMEARSKNTYVIRRVIKGAVVENLMWDDEWSALYEKVVAQSLETSPPPTIAESAPPNVKEKEKEQEGVVKQKLVPKKDYSELFSTEDDDE